MRWSLLRQPTWNQTLFYSWSMKYWQVIANDLIRDGWSLGWMSFVTDRGENMFSLDAHAPDGRLFVVQADEPLPAFIELEAQCMWARPRSHPDGANAAIITSAVA